MAVKFAGNGTLEALVTKIKTALDQKLDKAAIENTLTSTDTNKALSAAQGKVLNEKIGKAGNGDMLASKYDPDGDGKVTNAENADKLGNRASTDYILNTDMTELTSEEVEALWGGE